MKRTPFIPAVLVIMGLAIVGLGAETGPVTPGAQQKLEPVGVKIDNFTFGPAELTVPVGTTVTWTNRDDVPHNVVSTERKFASPVLDTNEQFSHTFDAKGTHKYYCSIHPKMTGEVIVV